MESRTEIRPSESITVSSFCMKFFSSLNVSSYHYLSQSLASSIATITFNMFRTHEEIKVFIDGVNDDLGKQHFLNDVRNVARLNLSMLGIQKISFDMVNQIFSGLLNKKEAPPAIIAIADLDSQAVNFIFSVCTYLARRRHVQVVCGPGIDAIWQPKFNSLNKPEDWVTVAMTQLRTQLNARNSDRASYFAHTAMKDQLLEVEHKQVNGLRIQNLNVEAENTRLQMQINDIAARAEEAQEKLATEYETKLEAAKAKLIAEYTAQAQAAEEKLAAEYAAKALADKDALIIEYEAKEHVAEEKFTAEHAATLSVLQKDFASLKAEMQDMQTAYPVLFLAKSIMKAEHPDPIAAMEEYDEKEEKSAPKKRSLEVESVGLNSPSPAPELKRIKLSEEKSAPPIEALEEESISSLLKMKNGNATCTKLREKIEKELLDVLTRRIVYNNAHKKIASFARDQLRVGESVLTSMTPFFDLGKKSTGFICYLASTICSLPKNTEVFYDNGQERQLLLTTIANMWRTIDVLNVQYTRVCLRLSKSNSEIVIAQLIKHKKAVEISLEAANKTIEELKSEKILATESYAKLEEKQHRLEADLTKAKLDLNKSLVELTTTKVDISLSQANLSAMFDLSKANNEILAELERVTNKYSELESDQRNLQQTLISIMHLLPANVCLSINEIIASSMKSAKPNSMPARAQPFVSARKVVPQPAPAQQTGYSSSVSSSSSVISSSTSPTIPLAQPSLSPPSFFAPVRAGALATHHATPALSIRAGLT